MARKPSKTKDRSLAHYGLALTAIGLAAAGALAVRKKRSTHPARFDQQTAQPKLTTSRLSNTKARDDSQFWGAASNLMWGWIATVAATVITKFLFLPPTSLSSFFSRSSPSPYPSLLGWLTVVAVVLTMSMPFILATLWLGLSNVGRRLRAWLSIWHLRMFFGALFFCYATWGHQWANDTINNLFHVDAKYFGITSTALTAISIPFGILYRHDVIEVMYLTFMVLVIFAAPYWVYYICIKDDVPNRGKKAIYSLAIATAGMVGFPTMLGASDNLKKVVTSFALWADFNESHPCTDAWAPDAKGVVFLDNDKVLAYFPNNAGDHFRVMSCNYAKTF